MIGISDTSGLCPDLDSDYRLKDRSKRSDSHQFPASVAEKLVRDLGRAIRMHAV